MEFTIKEKQALSKVLGDLIRADGKVDVSEAEQMFMIFTHFQISTQIQEDGRKLTSEQALEILGKMDRDKRAEIVKYMHEMADADGQLDHNEMKLILKVIHPERDLKITRK
jgi:uncharacterized tellurite resistance protein B-like protein